MSLSHIAKTSDPPIISDKVCFKQKPRCVQSMLAHQQNASCVRQNKKKSMLVVPACAGYPHSSAPTDDQ